MAYRSSPYRKRRSGYRRTRRPRRTRGGYKRRYGYRYGKRRGVRKGGRNRISPYEKRKDTVKGAHETNDTDFGSIGTPNTLFGYCPTFLGRNAFRGKDIAQARIGRDSRTIGFSGYKERVLIATSSPLIWRRIVIWTYIQAGATIGPTKDGGVVGKYATRQITPIEIDSNLRSWLFRGSQGIDYTKHTLHEAPLNTDNFRVQMDRTQVINPTVSSGDQFSTLREKKFWNPGGKIIYDEDEAGNHFGNSLGWSVPSGPSKGNMYIFDLFTDGMAHTSDVKNIARFAPQGIRYWVEG